MSCRAKALSLFTVAAWATSAAFAAPLQSQDAQRPALTLGGLPSLGLTLPLGSRWAIRPDVSLNGVLQYSGGVASVAPSSSVRAGAGISALRSFGNGSDSLRHYLVARLGYLSVRFDAADDQNDTDAFEAQVAAGVGVQYQASDRFGLFAELVADYGLLRSELGIGVSERTVTTSRWGIRPSIGVTLRRSRRASD